MLTDYLNQSISWEAFSSYNDYGEEQYSTATTIKGRQEAVNKLVRNAEGAETLVSTVVYTEAAVAVRDKLNSRYVISSAPMPDLDGTVLFHEVYLQ